MFTRPVDAAVCRETVNAGRKHVQPRAFSGKPGLSRHRHHHHHHIYHPSPHHRHHHYPPSISGHCHQPCCSQFGNYPSVHVSDNNSSIFLAIYLVPIISTMEICCCKENGCCERLIVNCFFFMERFIWLKRSLSDFKEHRCNFPRKHDKHKVSNRLPGSYAGRPRSRQPMPASTSKPNQTETKLRSL